MIRAREQQAHRGGARSLPGGQEVNHERQIPSVNDTSLAGVTADDVTACIELMLGRTPDPETIESHLKLGFPDRFALGEYVLGTAEFENRYATKLNRNADTLLSGPHRGGARRPAGMFLGDRIFSFTHRGHIIYLVPYGCWADSLDPSLWTMGTARRTDARQLAVPRRHCDRCRSKCRVPYAADG